MNKAAPASASHLPHGTARDLFRTAEQSAYSEYLRRSVAMASKYGKKASEKTSWEFRSGVLSSFLWSGGALPGRGVPSRVGRCNEVRHRVPRFGRSTPACRSPTTRFQTSPERRARLTWRARGLHERAPGAAFAGRGSRQAAGRHCGAGRFCRRKFGNLEAICGPAHRPRPAWRR